MGITIFCSTFIILELAAALWAHFKPGALSESPLYYVSLAICFAFMATDKTNVVMSTSVVALLIILGTIWYHIYQDKKAMNR